MLDEPECRDGQIASHARTLVPIEQLRLGTIRRRHLDEFLAGLAIDRSVPILGVSEE
jgi:hypothetical protein